MNIKYNKELLKPIIKDSFSWSEVCKKIGVKPATGSQSHIKNRAILFNIDYKHFTGQGWRKGKILGYKNNIEEYLNNKKFITSHQLKERLFKENLKEKKCEKCKLSKWNSEEIILELDHINRNHFDNRIENLMILCPNCHAQKTRNDRK